ncbi:hypothetical protein IQ266_08505 [filamentous cyanobacterium LEGE 11480]|uniref:Uncharacterized protein n=1 Tax=Romeriopsis navalis LEGE 11480 TaxID=2777977 RepID=A0A928VJJ4_9CYAN|nr:hypothetical protein [Romeriopsis navalis]MBE9029766.1 hypothetical protein [Romeriopsis navalis LEGE 11480]
MSLFRRFSLPALMLTTLVGSAMSIAATPQLADASSFVRTGSLREDFNNKYDRKHYVRGECFVKKRRNRIFITLPTGSGKGARVRPATEVKCYATVHKRRLAAIRLRRTRKLHVKSYFVDIVGDQVRFSATKKSRTCNGKACGIKIKSDRNNKTVGMTACIESRGKSRIVRVGMVPTGLDRGFKAKRCSQRKY